MRSGYLGECDLTAFGGRQDVEPAERLRLWTVRLDLWGQCAALLLHDGGATLRSRCSLQAVLPVPVRATGVCPDLPGALPVLPGAVRGGNLR